MLVSRPDLERSLERIRATIVDPRAGIHGPGSPAWRLQREAVVFLGGGRAALLQLAHPFVAYAIDQHSKTRADVVGRFQRTFMNVFAMTFGDLDEAFTAARRVHNVHTRITGTLPVAVGSWPAGTRYHANDVEGLLWVYATLMHTVVQVIELVQRPLSLAEKDAYYRDTWAFARLFGIPDEALPPTWAAFDAYVVDMMASPKLTVADPARSMSRFLLGAPPGRRQVAAGRLAELITGALLPERLRAQYGLRHGVRERLEFAALLAALRPGYRLAPRRARYLPAYVAARRRVAGKAPSAIDSWLEQRLFGLAAVATGQ